MKTVISTVVGTVLLLLPAWAGAQDTPDTRLQDLERRVEQLEAAQDGLPLHDFQMTGYMSSTYVLPEEGHSTFMTGFNPLFLYKAGDRFLFEAELEMGFEGEATELELEYAQLNYMVADNASIGTGKFLLPFGIFGERGHPAWINKLPTAPLIYGGHGGFAGAIIPVLKDFGAQVRGSFHTGGLGWNYAVYVVNGPRAAGGGGHDEEEGGHGGPEFVVNFGSTPSDENQNKAAGLRLGFLPSRALEVGLSYYTGEMTYHRLTDVGQAPGEEQATNPVTMTMLDVTTQVAGLDIRAEYLRQDTSQLKDYSPEVMVDETSGLIMEARETPESSTGYYVQAAYRFPNLPPELVVRYGAVSQKHEEGEEEVGSQTALGVNWWLEPSLVLKVAGIANSLKDHETEKTETTTDYYVQLAFGF